MLRQLQQGLAKCYSVAFEKSGAVSDAKITPHTLNFVKKLVSTFGVGLENVSNVSTMFSSAASESLARRAQATAQDPVFQKLKGQFTTGEPCTGHVLLRLCVIPALRKQDDRGTVLLLVVHVKAFSFLDL